MLTISRIVLWLNILVGLVLLADALLSRSPPSPLAVAANSIVLTLSFGFLGVIAAIERARIERAAQAAAQMGELALMRVAMTPPPPVG